MTAKPYDILIIGGGINGVGIARDAAGRGLSVMLAEQDDLAQATSSASTKLFHGGLRYLEFYEFRLVREALKERETLLAAMPHISWPMRFVLPHHSGLRPKWLLRLGLFLYDHLGGRKILPATKVLDLKSNPVGRALKPIFKTAFEYSDCWVQDARLVSLNARDAAERGAAIATRTRVTGATRRDDLWTVTVEDRTTGLSRQVQAKSLINAAGPWVADMITGTLGLNSSENVRLVRGSHIVTRKLFDHDQPYFFQGTDGRIIFAIPYEQDFTLIGTTEAAHDDDPSTAECSAKEAQYLCDFASEYLAKPITKDDIIWTYSGVRPLYDDGASSATEATREYVLSLNSNGAPLLNIFGGKITTYRKLAEAALHKLSTVAPIPAQKWTAGIPLAGGDFPMDGVSDLQEDLIAAHPFLTPAWALRLIRNYGTESRDILAGARALSELGQNFGATLYEAEVRWLMTREFAQTAQDVLWRRTKIGLHMSPDQVTTLDEWMASEKTG